MNESLAAALEREHVEIDAGIEAWLTGSGPEGESAAALDGLQTALAALRRHIYLEEELLFPPLRDAGMMGPIMVMLREHAQMWQVMDRLDTQLAGGGPADADAAESARATIRELVMQLEAHNPKEEHILYPQADQVLSADAATELQAFLATGATPEGWTCQGL